MLKKLCNWILGIHPNSISFWETFKLTGLPIISLTQGDNTFNFVLDTGSDHNIIDKNIIGKINHEIVDVDGSVFGINGQLDKTQVCSIVLSHKDVEYPANYLICDMEGAVKRLKNLYGVNVHGLIGSEFFHKYQYVLDFKSLIAYSKK